MLGFEDPVSEVVMSWHDSLPGLFGRANLTLSELPICHGIMLINFRASRVVNFSRTTADRAPPF